MHQSTPNASTTPALSGVKVVELSRFDAGSLCAQTLAWLGADVVKIEEPEGDVARLAATETPGVDSYHFILLNANKRSAMVDLSSKNGKENLRKLITSADVFIENLAPGSIERLGFGYEVVRDINPDIIYAQIKGFFSDGPRANYLSTDVIAQAVGGALSGTGYKGGPPLRPGPAIGDTATALHGAMGVLAALHQRRITGAGQRIEVAMQGAVINTNRNVYQALLTRGKPVERMGNIARTGAVPSDLYVCKPGGLNDYVFVNISNSANGHWEGLIKVMGREELLNDPKFSTPQARSKHREEIDAMVSAWCRGRTKIEAMEAIQGAGAPAGAVLDMQDLSEDTELRKRGTFGTINHPIRGEITIPGWPVKMSESYVPVSTSPLLGAHTQEVLAEWAAVGDIKQRRKPALVVATRARDTRMGSALSGVRVVDLTQFEAGTSCTEALAWLGADVVKVEEPQRGDRGRFGRMDKPGDSYYFILLNANKRSLTCDLKSERGKQLLRKLIINADVMIENLAPGAIERLGFGYDVVRQLNPRLIFAQIKGFPSEGHHANYLCFDMIAQAAGGSISLTGVAGEPPLRAGPNLGDTGGGMHCATGILAALCQRQLTDRGQRVEVAMQEAVINFSRPGFASYLASGKPPERHGNQRAIDTSVPSELYPCEGGGPNDYCFIHASEAGNEQWQRLLRAIAKEDLIEDPRFVNSRERAAHKAEIDALLSAWCQNHTKIEVMDIMQDAGVPAGAVFNTQELLEDPHLRKGGMFATIEHPVHGPVTMPAWPVRMSKSNVPLRSAPLLGAHTEEVLSEWLGMSVREIEEFRNGNPVGDRVGA